MEQLLTQYWPVLATMGGGLIWFIRLEGKVNFNAEMIRDLKTKHEALDSELVKELAKVRESLARIEGRLMAEERMDG